MKVHRLFDLTTCIYSYVHTMAKYLRNSNQHIKSKKESYASLDLLGTYVYIGMCITVAHTKRLSIEGYNNNTSEMVKFPATIRA